MNGSLEGRVAVVTGGSRGLGRAMSLELARRGAFVAVNYRRNRREAEHTLDLIRAEGGAAAAYPVDVTDEAAVGQMFDALYEAHGRVDVLVNNAGITRDALFLMMRRKSWDQVLHTNLGGVYLCTRAVLRGMCAAGRGVIINIGSGSGLAPRVGQTNYSTSKAALVAMTRSLAREVAGKGVRVLTVAPGFTRTEMSELVASEVEAETLRRIPLGRWGEPEEVARVVGFMASDAASCITGQLFAVDGGRIATEIDYGF